MDPQQKQHIKALISKSAKGDEEAFHELYGQLSDPLFKFVITRVSTREDALDIAQEVFIDVWKTLPKFSYKSDKQFYKFVYTIARRKLVKYYKTHKTVSEWSDNYILENYETNVEDWRYMRKAIEQLKEKYREVLELRYWSDFSFAQIANAVGASETTVKVRHHRAIKQLEEILEPYE